LSSEVYHDWLSLLHKYEEIGLLPTELEHVKTKITARTNFIIADCHKMAYVLDPRYETSSRISSAEKNQILELIFGYNYNNSDADVMRETLMSEYRKYVLMVRDRNNVWVDGLLKGENSVYDWWQANTDDLKSLPILAKRLFSLAPSSSSVERSFKIRGIIHSKTRNRLTHERSKLTAIKLNLPPLNQATKQVEVRSNPTSNSSSASPNVSHNLIESNRVQWK
jgi:hypothetical protein